MSVTEQRSATDGFAAVVVAASLGGIQAVGDLAAALPDDFPVPVLVAQHGAGASLASLLARQTSLPVAFAKPATRVPGMGIVVVANGLGLSCIDGTVRYVRGSDHRRPADVLFATATQSFLGRIIAVVLTGRLDDGAVGARAVKRAGGRVVVQDPATAQAPGMPTATLATGCVDFVLPVSRVVHALVALTMAPGGASLLAVATPSWVTHK